MNDLERGWARLVEAASRATVPDQKPAAPDWVSRMARQGLAVRTAPVPRSPERLAWAGLAAVAAAAASAVLLWPGPIAAASEVLAAHASALPRALPRAPHLPPEARPTLPPARDALAALSRWPELTVDLPSTSRRTETP
ncbi:MAG: hypothetical protein ACXU88_19195 [Myxococcaceae bacterium]